MLTTSRREFALVIILGIVCGFFSLAAAADGDSPKSAPPPDKGKLVHREPPFVEYIDSGPLTGLFKAYGDGYLMPERFKEEWFDVLNDPHRQVVRIYYAHGIGPLKNTETLYRYFFAEPVVLPKATLKGEIYFPFEDIPFPGGEAMVAVEPVDAATRSVKLVKKDDLIAAINNSLTVYPGVSRRELRDRIIKVSLQAEEERVKEVEALVEKNYTESTKMAPAPTTIDEIKDPAFKAALATYSPNYQWLVRSNQVRDYVAVYKQLHAGREPNLTAEDKQALSELR